MGVVESFLQRIRPEEIVKQEGTLSLLFTGNYDKGMARSFISKYVDHDPGPYLMCYKGRRGIAFYNEHRNKEHVRDAYRRFGASRGVLAEHEEFCRIERETDRDYGAFPPRVISLLSDADIKRNLRRIVARYHDLLGATLFVEALDEQMAQQLYAEIRPDGFDEFFRLVSRDAFDSLVARRLAVAIEEPDPYRAQWVFVDYYEGIGLEDVPVRRARLLESEGGAPVAKAHLERLAREIAETKEAHEQYLAGLDVPRAALFRFIQLVKLLRDRRSDVFIRRDTILYNHLRELFSRKRYPLELLPFAYYQDFDTVFGDSGYVALLERRSRGVCKLTDEAEAFTTAWSFDFDDVTEKLFALIDAGAEHLLHGRGVHPGCATGPARIILSADDFGRFRDGDVLVTSMTRPDFVPLMRKACAIVTDEGGLTCHAAIVARELGKPCIVGTRQATRTFRDGERVLVDAARGTVARI